MKAVLGGTLLKRRVNSSRWIYLACGFVVLFVVAMGLDHGLADVWPYVLLLALCLLQAAYPTVLGWLLIFLPFAAYTVVIAIGMPREPMDEYLLFLVVCALPACLLWWLRPDAGTS